MSAVAPIRPTTVVFDLGGVLIEWDPRHLYRQLFDDPGEMESFLAEVTTAEWNARQDAGRPWAEGVDLLVAEHPQRRELIEAFHRRWPEMLAGEIPGTVDVLADLRAAGVRLVALSNWSAEMFPIARERFDFLAWFEGIVISGDVGVNKPDRRIFDHLAEQFGIEPHGCALHRRLVGERRSSESIGLPRDQVHRRDGVASRTGATGAPSYPGDLIDIHRVGLIRRASTSAWGTIAASSG